MRTGAGISIGQRLGIGFGLVLLVFAAVLALFFHWHSSSSLAQAEYTGRLAPLRDAVHRLERDVYQASVHLRSVLLEPDPLRVGAFQQEVGEARAVLARLAQLPMHADERAAYASIPVHARRYLEAAEDVVARRSSGTLDSAEEARLSRLREALIEEAVVFARMQERSAAEALETIQHNRDQATRGMLALGLLTGVMLALLAWITARSVSRPAAELMRTVDALEAGDWGPALQLAVAHQQRPGARVRDEMRRLAHAFGGTAVALQQREQRLLADRAMARAVASSLERDALASQALACLLSHLGAEVGVVYSLQADGMLVPAASHALEASVQSLALGEGIPGQAARERRAIVLQEVPEAAAFQVRIGYDQAPTRALAAVPLLFGEQLHGVLVVGALRPLDEDALDFLEAAATQVGIGLQNVSAYEHTQRLLAQVRASKERVQSQNEELQVQNEEIQAQNEEIQAQSQQLQVQHEEMQAQNEELLQQGEELRRHAELLSEADERKNSFLGVLAHELRNPMAPIVNSIHILKRAPHGGDMAQRAQAVIERQARHLVRLIDDLLDVTRVSQGKIHIRREPLDLAEVVRSCVEDLGSGFEQAGINLQVQVPAQPVPVHGDHTRLCQVLGNLLHNSQKFCDPGSDVRLQLQSDAAARTATLRVSDDGIGLDPQLLPRLFQPFSQGAGGLARTQGGLGLGLALVKALVEMHGGSVQAHSEGPGRGADFVVRLPMSTPGEHRGAQDQGADADGRQPHAPATAAAQHDQASAHPSLQAQADPATEQILVIEDNADAAATLREALQLEGFRVELARSGSEGVRMARRLRPDVVLCDIGLPDQDGYAVARELRADPGCAGTVLIALTGYASDRDRRQADEAGFDLHLAKPLGIASLRPVLERVRQAADARC